MRVLLAVAVLACPLLAGASTCLAAESEASVEPGKPARLSLWHDKAPIGDGKFEQADAWLTIYLPTAEQVAKSTQPKGTAAVICPGGGYGQVVVQPEGHGIAKWLNRHGIAGAVLEYRLPAGRHEVPLLDAQRALRTVRLNASAWQLDPARIGIVGFSAGGHLASTAGTHFDEGDAKAAAKIDQTSCRPDFMILVYPVVTMGQGTHGGSKRNLLGENPSDELVNRFSNEKQVTPRSSPAFLAHALNDEPVPPENSQVLYDALVAHKVEAEYLKLPSGGHGLDGYKGPMWDAWQTKSLEWLARLKLKP